MLGDSEAPGGNSKARGDHPRHSAQDDTENNPKQASEIAK